MEWATWSLEYLAKARKAVHDDFNAAMEELRGYQVARNESWYSSCKNIIATLYHFSSEFVESIEIPSERFASPDVFEVELNSYRAWVQGMADELDREDEKYQIKHKVDGPPFLITVARRHVAAVTAAIDYVVSKKPHALAANPVLADVDLILGLARRFHESVLSLKNHPHNGVVLSIKDEWDCQYLFRAILAAYIADVRDEEWNPSVAGSSARCEFYLKTLRTMVELKYVRKAADAKKIKTELATDFLDYGKNPQVDHVICLVYDPGQVLKTPAAIQADLSGSKSGLMRVEVIISPPRD
ncbi:PD-(D/E)XK nuclease domain-containing protein [Mesorhizobium sp. PL10]